MQMHIIEHLGTTQAKERQSTTTLHTTLSKLHKNLQLPPPSQRELQPGMTAPWTRLLLEGGCPLAGTTCRLCCQRLLFWFWSPARMP